MEYAAILIASLAAGGFLGAVLPVYFDCRALRKDLSERALQFEALLRTASEANVSHASKLLDLEEKVNNVRMYIDNTAATGGNWGKR